MYCNSPRRPLAVLVEVARTLHALSFCITYGSWWLVARARTVYILSWDSVHLKFTHRRLATCRPHTSDTNALVRTPYVVYLARSGFAIIHCGGMGLRCVLSSHKMIHGEYAGYGAHVSASGVLLSSSPLPSASYRPYHIILINLMAISGYSTGFMSVAPALVYSQGVMKPTYCTSTKRAGMRGGAAEYTRRHIPYRPLIDRMLSRLSLGIVASLGMLYSYSSVSIVCISHICMPCITAR